MKNSIVLEIHDFIEHAINMGIGSESVCRELLEDVRESVKYEIANADIVLHDGFACWDYDEKIFGVSGEIITDYMKSKDIVSLTLIRS